jgi:glutamate/tyrosine decarboxylase-like PLP-dependent enzyme
MNDRSDGLLQAAADHAIRFLGRLDERPVAAPRDPSQALAGLTRALADGPVAPADVLDQLVAEVDPGITAMGSPRYFGFVIGGALPVALAADWMVSTWDQNAGLASPTPGIAAVEQIAGGWVLELLGLPGDAAFAFVTGCQMAHVTALAAARYRVLARAGWDVEADGLIGGPPLRVLVGGERHVTVDRALRFLGLGTSCIETVDVDADGAMSVDALGAQLDVATPTIVCAQVGNVNTGAIDPMGAVCDTAHAAGAWVHVDGAFGLWANASPRKRHLVAGCENADSWATDAHKWLNVPYDCGVAAVRDRDALHAAMAVSASYLQQGEVVREPVDWTPEFSRRARSLPVYAAIRALGRDGVAELVDRLCACADRFADSLGAHPGMDVLSHCLNQTLVRLHPSETVTDRIVREVQREGTCWMSATTWRGVRCMRISVSSWRTTLDDVDRSVAAIVRVRDAIANEVDVPPSGTAPVG